jgi:hypothetical protein
MSTNTHLPGLLGLALLSACAAGSSPGVTGAAGGQGQTGGSTGSPGSSVSSGTGEDLGFDGGLSGAGGSTPMGCVSGLDDDRDKDGWTVQDGDCNDCDPNVNPGAIEVIVTDVGSDGKVPPPADEDCDGKVDNVLSACDDNLALDDVDPKNGARAVGLCQFTTASPTQKKEKTWGVIDARYVRADGTTYDTPGLQVGIQSTFGPNVHVQEGKRMLELSSGHARSVGQPDMCQANSCVTNNNGDNSIHGPPMGFPQSVPNCKQAPWINDDVGLEVKLRAPTNATGYSFNFDFYSFEFPRYVCTSYNDQFVALVDPPPMGAINGNITFDSKTNPVSVNLAFFSVCDPASIGNFAHYCAAPDVCPTAPMPYCPSGAAQLEGTGFSLVPAQDAGATSWLKSQAPVHGGQELSIRFAIWDTGDVFFDSAVLVDNFQWVANGGSVSVSTDPIDTPK